MDLRSLQSLLADLPEIVHESDDGAQADDLLATVGEISKVLRKVGLQQTRSGTEVLGAVEATAARLDEVHQAALDARDRAAQAERQAEKLAHVVIGQLDLVERATTVMREAGGLETWAATLAKGAEQTLTDAAKWGLVAIGVVGETFDPQVHDAVNSVGVTDRPVVVAAIHRRGFTLNGRPLRRAEVEIRIHEEN
jgi:molecular chaperone GrpE